MSASGACGGSTAVLRFAGRTGASRDRGVRSEPVVRADAGRAGARVMDRGCGTDPGLGGAAAEDGPAGCGAFAEAAAGRAVSAVMGAIGEGAGRPAVAGAPASASAAADAGEEPVASAGAGSGVAEETAVVEQGGAPGTGEAEPAAICSPAAGRTAGYTGSAGEADWRVGPGGEIGSAKQTGSSLFDDASGGRAEHGAGHGADAGSGGAVRQSQASVQLFGTDPARAQQRRAAAVGTHQQAGQRPDAVSAGGSRTDGSPGGRRIAAALSALEPANGPEQDKSGCSAQAGDEVVLDAAHRKAICAAVVGSLCGPARVIPWCGGKRIEHLSGQPASQQ